MPQPSSFDAVFGLEGFLGASWQHIRSAHQETLRLHEELTTVVEGFRHPDGSIVVFGSLGRFEVTNRSDIDWTYLIDGQANLRHQQTALQAATAIAGLGREEVGREGVFGNLSFSHDILQYIGGQNDTNANLTRRILLLLESKPIGERRAYDSVLRVVLERYLSEDAGWLSSRRTVPRFLYNDIARYWRTVTVDYAYKQWTRDNLGWALRNAKLRMSRKLTYAAGLLYCYSLADDKLSKSKNSGSPRMQQAIDHLLNLSARAPLDILAEAFASSASLNDAGLIALTAYDEFLGILQDQEIRAHLKKLRRESAEQDHHYQTVRELGQRFQRALSQLFLENESTQLPMLTRKYGVF